MKIKPILVTINRDATEILPRLVFAHEIAVLEHLYGEGQISAANEQPDLAEVELEGGVDEAYDRLVVNFGEDAVRAVYFNKRQFTDVCDELYGEEAPKKRSRAAAQAAE